ncbi:MAG: tRNA-dihydrouridine synthase [Candidatus Peribacteraceae bacterium]|nr:tRNA-dihydrouridine synthase [Candidatus Peribacteraceae bacterium]MDD5739149.1 tRNA-dihydrouridine synthase [Candidatus Peribacteraceae bacterium]
MPNPSNFRWQNIPRPIVALAPMAGVTDASYRQLIKKLAPEVVVYSEFLSTDALAYSGKKTMAMMHFDPKLERPFIVQIFGKKPEHFLEAAKIVEQMGADGIDINMGCPAAKVVSSCHGSALIKTPELAAELVHATVKSVSIPVSVKTRLGWNTAETLIPFCTRLVEAGAQALAVHGRRFLDKFTGSADWAPIYALKDALPTITIIGNGDICCAQDALDRIGNLDGVMIGRGTIGNPWLCRDVCDAFSSIPPLVSILGTDRAGRPLPPEEKGERVQEKHKLIPTVERLSFAEKIPFILEHCALAVKTKGERKGMLEMRTHLAHYVKGMHGAKELRARLVRVETLEDVRQILAAY